MKKLIFPALVFLVSLNAVSQNRPYINEIISQIGTNSNAYFLAANRLSLSTGSYLTPKGDLDGSTGISFNEDVYDVPFDLSYGVTNRFELSAGITAYTLTYNYLGSKISGVGDGYVGAKFKFHESDYFDHVFGTAVKIPIASKSTELGTGKVDFHFGLAQGFAYKKFSYELGFECNLLGRKDFPSGNRNVPPILKAMLDSLRKSTDYKYEPEIVFSFYPGYDISRNVMVYAGYSFTRNTKLNFNTNSILGGIGVSAGNILSFSLGGSYGLDEDAGWMAQFGINFALIKKMY